MSRIADLERLLRTGWDRETLAVYADLLQADGDPRGELIAVDLHVEAAGATPALEALRRERLRAWLGVPSLRGRPWHPELFQFGLLDDLYIAGDARASATEYAAAFLDSPVAGYARGIKIVADNGTSAAAVLEVLARRHHPWLEFLAIEQTPLSRGPIPREVMARFLAAAPGVHTLDLAGRDVVTADALATARLRRLELRGTNVLVLGAAPVVGISELDIARVDRAYLAALVDRLPDLRALDVSGDEPASSDRVNIFSAVAELGVRRLRRVRLPALRHPRHAELVQTLLANAPDAEVEIARAYRAFAQVAFAHPRLHVPACRPWPPADTLANARVTITLPQERDPFLRATTGVETCELALADCVELLETDYDGMPADVRTAWTQFWQILATDDREPFPAPVFVRDERKPFPAAVFARALGALDDIDLATGGFGPWRALGEKLRGRHLLPDARVTIEPRGLRPTRARTGGGARRRR